MKTELTEEAEDGRYKLLIDLLELQQFAAGEMELILSTPTGRATKLMLPSGEIGEID